MWCLSVYLQQLFMEVTNHNQQHYNWGEKGKHDAMMLQKYQPILLFYSIYNTFIT